MLLPLIDRIFAFRLRECVQNFYPVYSFLESDWPFQSSNLYNYSWKVIGPFKDSLSHFPKMFKLENAVVERICQSGIVPRQRSYSLD